MNNYSNGTVWFVSTTTLWRSMGLQGPAHAPKLPSSQAKAAYAQSQKLHRRAEEKKHCARAASPCNVRTAHVNP